MKKIFKLTIYISIIFLILFLLYIEIDSKELLRNEAIFSFEVTCDMREFAGPEYQTSKYFMGTCEAIQDIGKGSFMVSPGDIDPPQYVYSTIKKFLGNDYLWYPEVGNHEAETPEDMKWLREWGSKDIPNLVRRGPQNCEETTYSFDFENSHFVIINQYYDGISDTGTDGDVCDSLYIWLKKDLESNSKPTIFVFGHEPIISIPDADNGRYRHQGDNLDAHPDNNHRFQKLLKVYKVKAYICGHTHGFSYSKINGLWQIDAAHCRGIGDRGARSTFLKVWVGDEDCWVDVYRDDGNGGPYSLTRTIELN
jgi:hypothetical protein